MIVIEHYYKQGVLSKHRKRWSAEDRLNIALKFYKHFRQAGLDVKAVDTSKIKVDTSFKNTNEIAMYADDRFRKYSRALPQDTVNVVIDVVIMDKIISGSYTVREREKEKLLRGLDALCDYHNQRRRNDGCD